MTVYQNFWDAGIETLVQQLDAPQSLQDNIVDTLHNSRRTGIFPNQIISALRIGLSIKERHLNIAQNQDGGSLWIIHKNKGAFQEERTYPRSKDPKQSKG